jgi:putative heme-binding domain-containing protein
MDFVGQPVIDFARKYTGALGRSIAWDRRQADPTTGRIVLDDLKRGAGDRGGFGYDNNGSPDLCAIAFTEIQTDRAGPGLLLLGSSGTMIVTVNEKIVYQYTNVAGRGYAPDADTARIELNKGKNRILVVSRQGIGTWAFGLKLARLEPRSGAKRPSAPAAIAELSRFALEHPGDPTRGEAIFFDPNGLGCARCHTVAGRGTAAIGPDLTGVAAKYDRAEVIRSVLDPSNRIAIGYQPVIVSTRDGRVETGVVRAESESAIELVDSEARITNIPKSDIEVRRVGNTSVMPAKLVETMAPSDFADLISFLMSLRQPVN